MAHPDADRWNARYIAEAKTWEARGPRQLLIDHADLLPEGGVALDAAAGVGANSLFLANLGLQVIALDISEIALRVALGRARACHLAVQAAVIDLGHLWLPADSFDVILNFYFLARPTFPVYQRALKPAGLLFFETFVKNAPDTDQPDYFLEPGELRQAFHAFKILHSSTHTSADRPGQLREQLIARRPL